MCKKNRKLNNHKMKEKMSTYSRSKKMVPFGFLAPYLISYTIFGAFPIAYSLYLSFLRWDGFGEKAFVGFQNYIALFDKYSYFITSIWNTLIIIVGYLPFSIIVGMILASILYGKYVKAKSFFQVAFFLPYLATPVAVGLLFSLLFDWQTGFVNTALLQWGVFQNKVDWLGSPMNARLIIIFMMFWKSFGYAMVFYLAGLAKIPNELYEAAWVDGASIMHTFYRITVPLLMPISVFLVITGMINGFRLLEEPMLLFQGFSSGNNPAVGGPDRVGLTAVWNLYDTAFGQRNQLGLASAMAYGLTAVIAVFSFFGLKLFKGGKNS